MPEEKILIIDDDKQVLESLELLLKHEFGQITTLSNPNLIPELIHRESYDLILLDMNFSAGVNTGNEGIYWLEQILKSDPGLKVILITAFGDIDLAVKALKMGATDFIQKPWNAGKLVRDMKAALELHRSRERLKKLEQNNSNLRDDLRKFYPGIIGESAAIRSVHKSIGKVANTDANVIILGENGTGKELVARELHRRSLQKDEAFVRVDLAALPPSLFESELFGHTRGAFTDARESRTGRFEAADGGTLFLDEIGNLPISLQSKILTVLESREIVRLGSNKPVPVNLRLISATNKDLEAMVDDQLFRQDLLYRINTVRIELPPLRQRGDDIMLLAEHFTQRFAGKYDKPGLRIGQGVIEYLKSHSWPGNIRELEHAVENAVIMCESRMLSPADFNLRFRVSPGEESLNLETVEKRTIEKALLKHRGKYTKACSELGISRTTLYHKIKKYGL
jgi:DNA-binding NtrC family response regulator